MILRCFHGFAVIWVSLLLLFGDAATANAYSVLSHEEVVDMVWTPYLVPLLQARYPGLTSDQLREAHSYAYGGCLIQDLGYYPFGNKFYSDMLHYVRTGTFVENLLHDAGNADELAFALGALAHYTADAVGHPYINRLTAEENPKLKKKYGDVVTYEQAKVAHIRTEFGFDVVEVAHGRYSQDNYRDFIGFQVAKPLLDRAFEETYGMKLQDLLHDEDHAITTYRSAVSELIPKMTVIAATAYAKQIEKENPGFNKRKFIYRLRRTEFEKKWGRDYSKPGVGTRFLAFLVKLLPKIGPLKVLKPKIPNATQQDGYIKSVNQTVDRYGEYLKQLAASNGPADKAQISTAALGLGGANLDTGDLIRFGQYRLSDQTHERLLQEYLKPKAQPVPPAVLDHLVRFYADGPVGENQVPQKDIDRIHLQLVSLQQRVAAVRQAKVSN
ncbi:zinc dependent phospholipase C family protein [Terriglobus albidus]|uniref:zinc dependent phospholipase C family protein n=1 Tax=Terriglobus albidus TaxID=1592106 RepID=UPI0021DFADE0|nr:zinc dependent phospholipase C family protein [Terriglobus albidus]